MNQTTAPKKIVVIGGSGFLGSYIVRKCIAQGHEVLATNFRPLESGYLKYISPSAKWKTLDIMNIFDLEECFIGQDIVINTAAKVSFNPKSKKEALRLAIEGTANVVEAAGSSGIQKLVHMSSVAALGRKKMINHIDESSIFSHSEYDTMYGLSKFLAEQEVWRGHYEGLPTTILNPSMVIGAGPWGQSSTKIITSIAAGLSRFPPGSNGFVDVRDVAEAAVNAIHPETDGERFIISSDNVSYELFFNLVSQGLGLKTNWKMLTPTIAALAWRWEKIKSSIIGSEPSVTRDQVISMQTESHYQNEKSIRVLGLSYRKIQDSIQEATRQYVQDSQGSNHFSMLPM